MRNKDYGFSVTYTRGAPINPQDPIEPFECPSVTVTGTNIEAVCNRGMIQVRRFPTGILLEEVDCLRRTDHPNCELRCKLHSANELFESVAEDIYSKLHKVGNVSIETEQDENELHVTVTMPAALKTIGVHLVAEEEDDD